MDFSTFSQTAIIHCRVQMGWTSWPISGRRAAPVPPSSGTATRWRKCSGQTMPRSPRTGRTLVGSSWIQEAEPGQRAQHQQPADSRWGEASPRALGSWRPKGGGGPGRGGLEQQAAGGAGRPDGAAGVSAGVRPVRGGPPMPRAGAGRPRLRAGGPLHRPGGRQCAGTGQGRGAAGAAA
jgi:hypothetical protein